MKRLWSGQWKRTRRLVLARDRYRCTLEYPGCTGRATHVDHIVPRRFGGTDELANLRASCGPCNMRRGDGTRTPDVPATVW